jgi:RNA polymerase sigma-70 factor, ECF subfamily
MGHDDPLGAARPSPPPAVSFTAAVGQALTATLGGEPGGLDRLFAVLRPWLLARIRPRFAAERPGHGEVEDVEDLVQDICLAILKGLPTYQPATSHRTQRFLGWVHVVTTGSMASFYARRTRDQALPTDRVPEAADPADGPDRHAERLTWREDILRLFEDHLRPLFRDVLRHRFLDGLSTAETAAVTGLTIGSVRVTQHRALAEVRALVDHDLVVLADKIPARGTSSQHLHGRDLATHPSPRRVPQPSRSRPLPDQPQAAPMCHPRIPPSLPPNWPTWTFTCPTCAGEVVLIVGAS